MILTTPSGGFIIKSSIKEISSMTYRQTIKRIHQINHILRNPKILKDYRLALTLEREILHSSL